MKSIEAYPDAKHCELCGAFVCDKGIDPLSEHKATETIRRVAFLADSSPAIIALLLHRIAGRTERQIAIKLGISQPAVHRRITRARQLLSTLQR